MIAIHVAIIATFANFQCAIRTNTQDAATNVTSKIAIRRLDSQYVVKELYRQHPCQL